MLLHGQPGELVPETDALALGRQHAGGQALVQMSRRVARELLEEPELGPRRDDRDRLEHSRRRRAQARRTRKHRLPHGWRDLPLPSRERLRDEERVPGRPAMELVGVDAVRGRQLGNGLRGQGPQLEPEDPRARAQAAEHEPERMGAVELVVAIGGDRQGRDTLELAPQEAQDVERGLVGPVHVLEDEDRGRPGTQLLHELCDDVVRARLPLDELCERPADLLGDVDERRERGGREERVARTPENPGRPVLLGAEAPDEGGLAHAGLPGHERECPPRARAGPFQRLGQRRELVRALEEHEGIVSTRARCAPGA